MHTKGLCSVIFVLLIVLETFSDDHYSPEQVQSKIAAYTKMERNGKVLNRTGWGLLGMGIVCIPVGMAIATKHENETGEIVGIMIGGVGGGLGLGFGLVGTIAGSVLKGIGHEKRLEYEKRISIQGCGNGLRIVFDW